MKDSQGFTDCWVDTISEIRVALLEKLIAPVHEAVDARMDEEQPFCGACVTISGYYERRNLVGGKICDAAVIGGIYRGMTKALGGMPSRSAPDTKHSVVDLASSLLSTMANVSSTHDGPFGNSECSPRDEFQDLCNAIHDSIPTVVAGFMKSEYKEYMTKQREKTGLNLPSQEWAFLDHQKRLVVSRYWKAF